MLSTILEGISTNQIRLDVCLFILRLKFFDFFLFKLTSLNIGWYKSVFYYYYYNRRYSAVARQQGGGVCLTWVAFVDRLTTQNMSVDGEKLPGKALEKRWCSSHFLKAGRVEMDERWHGSLFQIYVSEATDENDLDFVIAVFRVGTHNYWQGAKKRSDRVGTYRGIRGVR